MLHKGSSRRETTESVLAATSAPNAHIRAVGYVRVSTDMQAQEGVSLDAQKEKLRAYCKLHEIELIGIYCDEGISANTLERPGLQSALKKLESGHANTLLVVKLDRLTRSLLDLDILVRRFFVERRYHLLSVSESLDTRTAMGRFVLYILGLIAQWEREAIGERTREAMAHLKRQGVQLGAVPFGYAYAPELDTEGRKRIVEVPGAQALVQRIVEMHKEGKTPCAIARQLRKERVPSPRSRSWSTNGVLRVLVRQGRTVRRRPRATRPPRQCDRKKAMELAVQGRAEGFSLRSIAVKLDEARLVPPRGGKWHAATVLGLLETLPTVDRPDVQTRARQLRAQGLSVRAIGRQLWNEGYRPERAMGWHNQAVATLLEVV